MNLHQLIPLRVTAEQLWRLGAGIERLLMECRDGEERAELLAIRKEITLAETVAAMQSDDSGTGVPPVCSDSYPILGWAGVGSAPLLSRICGGRN